MPAADPVPNFWKRLFGSEPLNSHGERSLRLWPAILVAGVLVFMVFGVKHIAAGSAFHMFGLMTSPMICGTLFVIWGLCFSRAPLVDRIVAMALLAAGAITTYFLADQSLFMDGEPLGLIVYGLPAVLATIVIWLASTQAWTWKSRQWTTAMIVPAACLFWALVRCDGLDGALSADMNWRWSPTPEQSAMARIGELSSDDRDTPSQTRENLPEATPLTLSAGDWPCFRNTHQDGHVPGVAIRTDWRAFPPREIWRRPVGPGWSSFSLVGNHLYTQEQRANQEAVVCYDSESGQQVWQHDYDARFYEIVAGAGPRATPTFHNGRLYSMGATGIITCLDARTGNEIWTRNLVDEVGAQAPEWGFASSPVIVHDMAVVHANKSGLVAFDCSTGEKKWQADTGRGSYSTAHMATIGGIEQLLMLTGDGLTSIAPRDGSELWDHAWDSGGNARVVQPVVFPLNSTSATLFLGSGYGVGTQSITVTKTIDDWEIEEHWVSRQLKPYFNDAVFHRGMLYGFDGNMLTCLDAENGKRQWKKGRFGHGQLVLLPDQDMLLVVSETGDLSLVEATHEAFRQIANMPAVSGKTWNHPIIAHGKLFVRNGEEAVCYELP